SPVQRDRGGRERPQHVDHHHGPGGVGAVVEGGEGDGRHRGRLAGSRGVGRPPTRRAGVVDAGRTVSSAWMARSALIWNDDRIHYDFGRDHPLKPIRVELTVDLIRACGLDAGEGVVTLPREPFGTDDVLALHDEPYVDAVRRLSADPDPAGDLAFGLGIADNPVFAGMHDASLEVCG